VLDAGTRADVMPWVGVAARFPINGRAPEFIAAAVDPVADGLLWAGVQARYSVSVRRAR